MTTEVLENIDEANVPESKTVTPPELKAITGADLQATIDSSSISFLRHGRIYHTLPGTYP